MENMPPSIPPQTRVTVDDVRLGNDPESLKHDFIEKLFFMQAKFPGVATRNDHYLALAYVVRDRLLHRWMRSARRYLETDARTVGYLSAEYLMGPQLDNAMLTLGITDSVRQALQELGIDLDDLIDREEEPGLGNGGLGRLAACYMDSLATLSYPAIGYGIRYEFGIFDQDIRDGWQVERTDRWLRLGNPWEIPRPQIQHTVRFGGHTEHYVDELGRYRVRWHAARVVNGTPFDTPVLGTGTANCNFLRLWSAVAVEDFDLEAFNRAEYWAAVDEKFKSENITKVLYPNDESAAGKRLRLSQQYFFVSCSLQDMLRILGQRKSGIDYFPTKFCIQLNDTHPAVAVPELLRILLDEHFLEWDHAWSIVKRTFSYTNHTLLPEALETWPLPLFEELLPRHLELIYEINARFLDEVRARFPGDEARLARMSLIDESGEKRIRMANLATVGANKVNGVAQLHSNLLRETVMRDFAELWPERFTNVTNGVTPRRFIALCNPGLSRLIDETVGSGWVRHLDRISALEKCADDAAFVERFRQVKLRNKHELSRWLFREHGQHADIDTLFDVQIKRIHEYKRQLLALLHALWLIERIRKGDTRGMVPRTLILGGKAAPGYYTAKLIIKLAHVIRDHAARFSQVRPLLQLVFVPDFNVKVAQRLYPAADLSEQISTAGFEASGTGNMKFTLNGALTIGTLDGANVEIRERVGAENFFLFGLSADEVRARKEAGYDPRRVLAEDRELADLLDLIAEGDLPAEPGLFSSLIKNLASVDRYLVLADFRSYIECQEQVSQAWLDQPGWARKALLNVARAGHFSSDRSIAEYADNIWKMKPSPVGMPEE